MDPAAAMRALLLAEARQRAGDLDGAEAAYFDATRSATDATPDTTGITAAADTATAADGGADGGADAVLLRARIGLGRVELRRGAPGRALGWFLSARGLAPGDWRPHYWRGCAQGRLGDHAGARESFTAGLRLAPGEPALKVQRCCAQLKLGERDGALRGLLTTEDGALDSRMLHAVGAAWLAAPPRDPASAQLPVAALVALLHDEDFWARFGAQRAAHYQVPVTDQAIAHCRGELEGRARELLLRGDPHGPSAPGESFVDALWLRETAGAAALRELGGLPGAGGPVVCGPVMVSLLGMQRALGDVVEHAPPDARRRLRMLFSGLGAAAVLLDADRPDDALPALREGACVRCRERAAPGTTAVACEPDCPDLAAVHPGYASAGGAQLAADAARLAIAVRLGVASRIVVTTPTDAAAAPDFGGARRMWTDAVELAATVGTEEQTRTRIGEAVLGRCAALRKKALFSAAVTLVENALAVLGESQAGEELRRQLAELLADRGVRAGNERRWDDSARDLRRAMEANPRALRPRVNLSMVLRQLARRRNAEGARAESRELLRNARRIVEGALRYFPDSPQVSRQLDAVLDELRSLCSGWAVELAVGGAYEEALTVLGEGLIDLPADERLMAARDRISPLLER